MKSAFENQIMVEFWSTAKLTFSKCRPKRKSTYIKSQFFFVNTYNNPWILYFQKLTQIVDLHDSLCM